MRDKVANYDSAHVSLTVRDKVANYDVHMHVSLTVRDKVANYDGAHAHVSLTVRDKVANYDGAHAHVSLTVRDKVANYDSAYARFINCEGQSCKLRQCTCTDHKFRRKRMRADWKRNRTKVRLLARLETHYRPTPSASSSLAKNTHVL